MGIASRLIWAEARGLPYAAVVAELPYAAAAEAPYVAVAAVELPYAAAPQGRGFAPRYLQTPPHDDVLALR
jgi:hypothetical protein